MNRAQISEISNYGLEKVLTDMELDRAYFDTSYVGVPEKVYGYKVEGNPYVSAERIETGDEMYERIQLLNESRQEYGDWKINYGKPHLPVEDYILVDLKKRYEEAICGAPLGEKELQQGLLFLSGRINSEDFDVAEIDRFLKD